MDVKLPLITMKITKEIHQHVFMWFKNFFKTERVNLSFGRILKSKCA
jgi:hypothetical protein